jgi:hypothetical protein
MKRLEYTRRVRTYTGHGRGAGDFVNQLAHMSRERHRLDQERKTLMRRIRRIGARLEAIATAEARLLPRIQQEAERAKDAAAAQAAAQPAVAPLRHESGLHVSAGEMTLLY